VIVDLVLDRELRDAALDTGPLADDFRVRFQQTCGPVMAKGIEDTAYYRWFRLAGANEVGGHPITCRSRPRSSTPGARGSSRRGRRR
jgi:(1->4)-alpha-D-glucan 1-alpha-D-glucosylmutase